MSKPIIVHGSGYSSVCLHARNGLLFTITQKEALQLAKDLLEACGATVVADEFVMTATEAVERANARLLMAEYMAPTQEPKHPASCPCNKCFSELLEEIANAEKKSEVSSGMSLDEIQRKASNIHRNYPLWDGGQELARLIANLAARMKENEDQAERNRLVTCSNLGRIGALECKALGIEQ